MIEVVCPYTGDRAEVETVEAVPTCAATLREDAYESGYARALPPPIEIYINDEYLGSLKGDKFVPA